LYPAAAAHAARGIGIGRRSGRLALAPTLIPSLGTATWVLGRVRQSTELLAEAVEASRLARIDQALAWNLLNLSLSLEVAGDVEGALRTGRESLALAGELDDSVIASWAGMNLGSALLEAGEPERALAV